MPRITCRQPSTGKPISISNSSIGIDWTVIIEAPDFSVPDPSGSQYTSRDPIDASRGIAAGEVFFLTPLVAKNNTAITDWIEVRFRPEGTTSNNDSYGRITVPAGESVAIPLQGRSLIKRDANSANGDIILVRAGNTASFHVWASANEQASAEHIGVLP